MSAVLELAPHEQAQAQPSADRSCFTCRHSRYSSDARQLYCSQPRAPITNGVAVPDTKAYNAGSVARHTARLCRYYQEER